MPIRTIVAVSALLTVFWGPALAAPKDAHELLAHWPQWRGPLANGVALAGDPPVDWAEDRNVRWKIELPGVGHGTPVIWGDRVYVTTAIAYGEPIAGAADGHEHDEDEGAHDNMTPLRKMKFVVLAIDRADGRIVWRRVVRDERPHEGTHVTGSWASASPLTDGERVYAHFGSRGLYALTLAGELAWERDLGDMRSRHSHGEGSSPALHGDTLVVNWDHQGDSFLVAVDKRTGKERWRTARDEITSWSTPLIVEHGGTVQVIVAATGRVRGYSLATGEVIWECGGLSRNVVASPVAADGIVYVGNSYDHRAMLAIRLAGAKGDVTDTDAVVWKIDRHTPYVPSPLLYDGMLFFLRHSQGYLSNLDATTGRSLFGPRRLPQIRNVFASPVGAAGRVYVTDREGTTAVVARAEKYELLAVNELDDSFSASPAIAGRELYLRGRRHLYCLAADPPRRESE